MKQALLYGLAGGLLLALLKLIEYRYWVRAYPGEVYGGLLALIFAAVGLYLGRRWAHGRERVVVAAAVPREATPFVANDEVRRALGITPREHEILVRIAEGLSNREIGERLYVSENTVKTHSSRVFQKLGVSRRTQAVQKARQLGLIP